MGMPGALAISWATFVFRWLRMATALSVPGELSCSILASMTDEWGMEGDASVEG